MNVLEQIEATAAKYTDVRAELLDQLLALNEDIADAKAVHLKGIKKTAKRMRDLQEELSGYVDDNRGMFNKPRTRTLHNVKVGLQKGKGKLVFKSEEKLIALIRKLFPKQVKTLVNVKETPVKKALEQLSAADLKRLGVTIEDDDDQVIVKPVDSEVEKMLADLSGRGK